MAYQQRSLAQDLHEVLLLLAVFRVALALFSLHMLAHLQLPL